MQKITLEKVLEILNTYIENAKVTQNLLDEDLAANGMDSMAFIRTIVALEEEFVPFLSNLTLEEMKIFTTFHGEDYNELCWVTPNEEHTLKYYIEEYLKIAKKLETEMALSKKKEILENRKDRKENLTKKEYDVLVLRYGLKDGKSRTLKEVGEILNHDKSYVCQIEKKALQKIKENPRIWNYWCQDEENAEKDLKVLLNEQPKVKAQHKATIQPKVEKTKKMRKPKDIFVVYTKEEYQFAIRFLTKQEQEIFNYRYGKNLDELNPWPKDSKYNYNQKIKGIIKKMQKNIEKYRQRVQEEFLKRLLECSFEEVRIAIPFLPKLEQEILFLKRGKSLLEYNSYPSNKPYTYYKKIEEDTIFHLKDIIRENRKKEKSFNQEELEKIKKETIEKRNQLLAEKLNNMKIKLFQELWKIYAGIITRDTLKDTIEGIVVDEKISETEYYYKIENSILVRATILYKENKDTMMDSLLLEQLKQIFTAKIKTKNPLYTKEQIEKAIEKVWTSYDGEYRFEDVIKRNLKQQ